MMALVGHNAWHNQALITAPSGLSAQAATVPEEHAATTAPSSAAQAQPAQDAAFERMHISHAHVHVPS
jgi:hypothetical protein